MFKWICQDCRLRKLHFYSHPKFVRVSQLLYNLHVWYTSRWTSKNYCSVQVVLSSTGFWWRTSIQRPYQHKQSSHQNNPYTPTSLSISSNYWSQAEFAGFLSVQFPPLSLHRRYRQISISCTYCAINSGRNCWNFAPKWFLADLGFLHQTRSWVSRAGTRTVCTSLWSLRWCCGRTIARRSVRLSLIRLDSVIDLFKVALMNSFSA